MIELLTRLAPDVLGTEEGLAHQLADIADGIGERYRMIGEHRHHDGGAVNSAEYSAIFYNTDTVELLDISHQWLSDTPEVVGSRTWGTHFPRMFSVARFRRLIDDTPFTVITTHVDHEIAEAQVKSANLLLRRAEEIGPDQPLVVMGDFNTGEDSEPYAILTGTDLRDAYLDAAEQGPRLGTFNNYADPDPDGIRIDWILVNQAITVRSARMVDDAPGGQFPSDHLPVEAVLEF